MGRAFRGASFQAFLGGSAQVLAGFPKSPQKLFESNAPRMSTPQFESQSGTCSTPCGILRRRGSMHMRCLDGVGRESWDLELAYVLVSPASPLNGGSVPVR